VPDLNKFVDWVREGKNRRNVTITIGSPSDKDELRIWAYDYDWEAGQHVTSVEEIDLEKAYREKMKRQFEEAKKYLEKEKSA